VPVLTADREWAKVELEKLRRILEAVIRKRLADPLLPLLTRACD